MYYQNSSIAESELESLIDRVEDIENSNIVKNRSSNGVLRVIATVAFLLLSAISILAVINSQSQSKDPKM